MADVLYELAEFITTPSFRWLFLFLSIVLNIIKYLNEPQRFSYKKAIDGLSYKWHMFLIALISCVSYCLMAIGLWHTVPFTDLLPNYWYIYLFIICLAIITQITLDSPQVADDGSFQPPPPYMFSERYRIMLTYASLVINILVMIQTFIYFGIADYSKKTALSRYFLERYGGWYAGNKLDFIYEWSGIIDIFIAFYVLYLQYTFKACKYGLPASWNF